MKFEDIFKKEISSANVLSALIRAEELREKRKTEARVSVSDQIQQTVFQEFATTVNAGANSAAPVAANTPRAISVPSPKSPCASSFRRQMLKSKRQLDDSENSKIEKAPLEIRN